MTDELRAATADLTPAERAGIASGVASARDRRAEAGHHRMAHFYALLAELVAEVDDEERRTLDDLERGLS